MAQKNLDFFFFLNTQTLFVHLEEKKKKKRFAIHIQSRQVHIFIVGIIIFSTSTLIHIQSSSWSTCSFSYFACSVKLSLCKPSLKVHTLHLRIPNSSPVLFFFFSYNFKLWQQQDCMKGRNTMMNKKAY